MLIHKTFQSRDKQDSKGVLRTERHTDNHGNLVFESEYNSDGELATIRRMKYDDKNQLIEEVIEGPDDVVYETHRFTYLDDGKLSEETVEYADGSVSTGRYEYVDHLISVSWFNEDDELEQMEETLEDEQGNVLSAQTKDADGTVLQKQEYVRDEKGRTTEAILYEEEHDSRSMYYEYAEDKEKGTKARVIKDHNGYVVQAIFEALDENGKVVEEIREEPARGVKHTHEYEYDDSGRLTELVITNDKGRTVQEHTMEYDDKGRITGEYLFAQPGIEMWSRHEYIEA